MGRRTLILALAIIGFAACGDPADPDPPTGSLQLSIAGIPDTINAPVTLTGPGGFSVQVPRGQTFATLVPGTYTISASQVVTSIATFVPAFQSQTVVVGANGSSQATVIYSVTTGAISVVVTGVPAEVPWKVHIAGPGGFRDSTSVNRTLGNLVPGIYTVTTTEARRDPNVYEPARAELLLSVTASLTPVPAVFGFLLTTGSLTLHLNGLPGGAVANVVITGPGGFSRTASGSTTFEGLVRGRYTVSAAGITSGGTQLTPSPAQQSVTIVAGANAQASVNYWPATFPPGLNLGLDAVHVQQVVQTYGGAVPLIAGRDALLRVFVRASEPNAAAPSVRVRLYDGAQLVSTTTIPAPTLAAGVPVTIDESRLADSWNLQIPAAQVKPGLRVLADVDPGNTVTETNETDNSWPSAATPLALDVRVAPPLTIRFVPITQSSNGLTGDITMAALPAWLEPARQLLPLSTVTADVRPTYTTNAPPLQPNDANGAWLTVLNELNALRIADGAAAHYYGVVKLPYTAGVVGVSFLPSFVALGSDAMPKATTTFVHELGHHFARLHSPNCGAGGIDANYPYAGGTIGVFGYDIETQTLRAPATPDIMGYCDNRWISDYTFGGIMSYRATNTGASPSMVAAEPGLLVWGRIRSSGIVLEPAFELTGPPRLPAANGPHRVEIFGSAGELLTALSFTGERPVDSPAANEEHFAFLVPISRLGGRTPARIRLQAVGRQVSLATAPDSASERVVRLLAPSVTRVTTSKVRLRWTDAPGRGVLVRDAVTGAILTFARGGIAEFLAMGQRVDLTFSDGVRSARRTVEVR
jgi:hypothetical protein